MNGRPYSFAAYARGRRATFAIAALCMAVVAWVMAATGQGASAIVLVSFVLLSGLAIALAWDYSRTRDFYVKLAEFAETPDSARVLAALLDEPTGSVQARVSYAAVEAQGRAATEEVGEFKEHLRAYREYVELWIHETKTPIASMRLALSGMHGPEADAIKNDLDRLESRVEQALYYARSSSLSNDYVLGEIDLSQTVRDACRSRSRYLISEGATPQVDIPAGMNVVADAKWLSFMLAQIVENAAKYGARTIRFSASVQDEGTPQGATLLSVADDGAGIAAADVPRVFDRGFTGSNGRSHAAATGMGLYLCAVMCERMGLKIEIFSEEGTGTTVVLGFPHDRSRMELALGNVR